jgi:hypothetical protein
MMVGSAVSPYRLNLIRKVLGKAVASKAVAATAAMVE